MASDKVIQKKKAQVQEIIDKFSQAESVVLFEYRGLSVSDLTKLRRTLRENNADMKVYKNNLLRRALAELNYDLNNDLSGPKAVAFGDDPVLPVKKLAEFRKENENLVINSGIVEGKVVSQGTLNELASIPSREGLIAMFASGLISCVRDFAVCIDLHRQNLEKK